MGQRLTAGTQVLSSWLAITVTVTVIVAAAGCGGSDSENGPSDSSERDLTTASGRADGSDEGKVAVEGLVVAGPTGPETIDGSGDETQPVADAVIVVRDEQGKEVVRARSGADGALAFEVSPGRYDVEPQPVDGLLGTASAQQLDVTDGQAEEPLLFEYDTGIR